MKQLPLPFPVEYIEFPLSKTGKKYKGKYTAMVSPEDAEVAGQDWCVQLINHRQYAVRTYNSKKQKGRDYLHRVIMARVLNRPLEKNELIDHINNCGTDNRRENLRLANRAQNSSNSRMHSNNKSGFRGVFWNTKDKKWRAQITVYGKKIYLGNFDDPKLASEAYIIATQKYQGEYASQSTRKDAA